MGATAVDFAYAVHTDVGNTCVGARVNRKPYPLSKINRGSAHWQLYYAAIGGKYVYFFWEQLGFNVLDKFE